MTLRLTCLLALVMTCCGPPKGTGDAGVAPAQKTGPTVEKQTVPTVEKQTAPAEVPAIATCKLAAGPLQLAPTDASAATPAAVWTGSRYGVTWLTGGDVMFAQADEEARLVGGTSMVVTDAKGAPTREVLRELDLLWTGSEYLVAGNLRRNKGRNVCAGAVPVDLDGTRKAGDPICVVPGTTIQFNRQVAFAWTGERILALASKGSLASYTMAASFDLSTLSNLSEQTVLDPAADSTAHDHMDFPLAVEWTGGEGRWVAARVRDDGKTSYYCGRIDADGKPLGPAARIDIKASMMGDLPVGLSRDRLPVAIASSGPFVARLQPGKLVGVPGFGMDGKPSGALTDLEAKTSSWFMALRGAGDHVWAVWLENRRDKKGDSYLYDMWAARLGLDGAMLGDPVLLTTDVRVGDTLHVDVADTPGGAAVVWTPLGKGAGVYMATIACQ